MKNYKKHIDDFIREKAGRDNETPPSHIWEDLDKQLDGLNSSAKPPVSYTWMRNFGIVSLILLLAVSAIMKLSGYANHEAAKIAKEETTAPETKNSTVVSAGTPAQTTQEPPTVNTPDNTVNNSLASAGSPAQTIQAPPTANTADNGGNNSPASTNKKGKEKGTEGKYAGADNSSNIHPTPKIKPSGKTGMIAANTGTYKNKYAHSHAAHPGINNYGSSKNNEITVADKQDQPQSRMSSKKNTTENDKAVITPQPVVEAVAANDQNSSQVQPAPSSNSNANNIDNKTTANKQPAPLTAKTENKKTPAKQKHDHHISKPAKRLEEGIKAGYETAFTNGAAQKYAVSPYLQYNISAKVSLLFQPAVKYAQLPVKNIGTPQSYYNINPDNTHDSIVKSYTLRGNYMEFELPILFKYYIARKFSLFGGVNLLYSKLPGVTENTYTQHNLPSPLNDQAYNTGSTILSYSGPVYQAPQTAAFHIGYMAGFSYEYNKNWLVDALMEQSPLALGLVGGYNYNNALSSYYFRLSVGYRLTNNVHIFHWGHSDYGRGD